MCSPAPALTPAIDCQESKVNNAHLFQSIECISMKILLVVQGKNKKEKKKNKMTKLDSRILGFSVTSAENRLNVGARDYARDGP